MKSDLEQQSIERIKFADKMSRRYYGKPITVTYSGGKDFDILVELFIRSGVDFEIHHSHTTVDTPQTVYHIREKFKQWESMSIKCEINMPKYTMWQLIVKKKMPPTRMMRYCYSVLKEGSCRRRMIATGVRWAESAARSQRGEFEILGKTKKDKIKLSWGGLQQTENPVEQLSISGIFEDGEIMLMNDNSKQRRVIESCARKAKSVCNPIIEWSDREVWEFLEAERIEINPLYEMGFERIGCVGCPMAGTYRREMEFRIFPKYKEAYIRAFDRMLDAMLNDGTGRIPSWKTGQEVFDWWMEYKEIPGQISIEDILNKESENNE